MRIVAGTHRGRSLLGPKGPGLRPTADRVRESVFNLLGQSFEGGTVLDLYDRTRRRLGWSDERANALLERISRLRGKRR